MADHRETTDTSGGGSSANSGPRRVPLNRHDQPFVRERAPRQTAPPVNDLQADDAVSQDYSHETSYTYSRGGPAKKSRTYRRSRSDVRRAKRELKYGQYLSVPKGSREIFGSRDRIRRRQFLAIGIVLAIIVVLVAVILTTR